MGSWFMGSFLSASAGSALFLEPGSTWGESVEMEDTGETQYRQEPLAWEQVNSFLQATNAQSGEFFRQ